MERPGWLNAGFLIFIYFLPQCLFLELRTSRFYCHHFFFLPTFEHFKTHFSQSFSSERNNFLQKSVDVEVKVIDLLLCFCFTQHFGGTVVWKSLWKSDDWTQPSVETFLNQRRKKKLLKWPLGRCWRICSRIGWGVRGWAETLPVETGGLIVVLWLEQCYTTAARLSVVVGKPLTEVTGSNEDKKPSNLLLNI